MFIDYNQTRLEDQVNDLINDPETAAEILIAAGILPKPVAEAAPESIKSTWDQISIVSEEVYQDGEFTYVLTKVPRFSKKKRDTPGLIPAAEFFNGINDVLGKEDVSSSPKTVNRSHQRNQYSQQQQQQTQNLTNGFATCNGESNSHHENPNFPMGINIFQRIRNILNLGTNKSGEDSSENRKRRAEEERSDKISPQIKYRKVENQFPKVIQKPFEEDFEYVPNLFRNSLKTEKQKLNLNQTINSSFVRTPLVMSQEGNSAQEKKDGKQKRNSLFVKPQMIRKNKTNALPYEDIEYSDDDEAEMVGSFNLNDVNSKNSESNFSSLFQLAGYNSTPINVPVEKAKPAKFCNIPINYVGQLCENTVQSSSSTARTKKPPVPPLIKVRNKSDVFTSNLPELRPINRLNGPASSSGIYASDGAFSFGQRTAKDNTSQSRIPTFMGETSGHTRRFIAQSNCSPRSILAQEQLNKDREQYSELLQRMVPRLYGMVDASPKPNAEAQLMNKKRHNFLVNARRSINEQENRPPQKFSAAISLTDDEEDDVDEIILSSQSIANIATILNEDDDRDVTQIIDLETNSRIFNDRPCGQDRSEEEQEEELPYVPPVNSLREKLELAPVFRDDWLANFSARWSEKGKEKKEAIAQTEKEVKELSAERVKVEKELYERMRKCTFFDPELVVVDEFPSDLESEAEEEEPETVEFTPEQQKKIQFALSGSRNDILITKFNMSITRRDIDTLTGLSWLNDEVINFYMNLLMDRSEKRHKSDGLPRVYSMNTFFVPRLLEGGHSAVRRWTRKVNIFDRDVIPVPVHVGGVHWCMAIIHLKNKSIKYYDSMGTPNPKVLEALAKYLQDESLDKLKQQFDTSDFVIESVSDVPHQFNGSDCGVFSCMFAEYVTRNKAITFTQEHMPFFRQKMILEIVEGELIM